MAAVLVTLVAEERAVDALWERIDQVVADGGDPIVERGSQPDGTRSVALQGGTRLVVHPDDDGRELVHGHFHVCGADEPLARQRGLQLLRALAPHAISGQLEALWPPFAYLPAVPLLGSALAAVGRKDWMRAWFQEDLAVPEGVDWEVIDGVTLASRLLDELDRDAFESRALVQNMALWFQASPGYTTPPQQARPPCPPRPPGILQAVGYDPATGEVEYAADVSADARVTWWELGELAAQVRDKRLSDGREILGVRVVFSREDAALANSVPLIDCGVRVLGYDSDGDEVEISWD